MKNTWSTNTIHCCFEPGQIKQRNEIFIYLCNSSPSIFDSHISFYIFLSLSSLLQTRLTQHTQSMVGAALIFSFLNFHQFFFCFSHKLFYIVVVIVVSWSSLPFVNGLHRHAFFFASSLFYSLCLMV